MAFSSLLPHNLPIVPLRIILKDQALDYYIDQAKAYYVEYAQAPDWYYPLGWIKQKIVAEN
ncbi:MAG: hypothetical protein AAF806_06235 [Bacteroidota bacterium]